LSIISFRRLAYFSRHIKETTNDDGIVKRRHELFLTDVPDLRRRHSAASSEEVIRVQTGERGQEAMMYPGDIEAKNGAGESS